MLLQYFFYYHALQTQLFGVNHHNSRSPTSYSIILTSYRSYVYSIYLPLPLLYLPIIFMFLKTVMGDDINSTHYRDGRKRNVMGRFFIHSVYTCTLLFSLVGSVRISISLTELVGMQFIYIIIHVRIATNEMPPRSGDGFSGKDRKRGTVRNFFCAIGNKTEKIRKSNTHHRPIT